MATSPGTEHVVLLDSDGVPEGLAPKATVHTTQTPLHLAFSAYLVAPDGRILITRRSLSKQTWPGVWTNSLCGHPGPDESSESAIVRRARQELCFSATMLGDIVPIAPDFRYEAVDASGIRENEICPVYRVELLCEPQDLPEPAADEVADTAWVTFEQLRTAAQAVPNLVSPWCGLQIAHPGVRAALG